MVNWQKDWTPKTALEKDRGLYWPKIAAGYRPRYAKHAPDMAVAMKYTKGRDVVIQAGGNVGTWAIWLAERFKSVYTFEPDSMNFYCLARNAWMPNVHKFQAALGDYYSTPVEMNFHNNNIGAHNVISHQGSIPCMAIDQLNLRKCDMIVLDIEGYEFLALKGAKATLEDLHPVLQLEDRGHGDKLGVGGEKEISAFLEPMGYRKVDSVAKDTIWAVTK